VYLLNLVAQGNAILVSGTAGRDSNETHGPVVGTWSRTMGLIAPPVYELGLTVMISNAGDFNQSNTENVVFQFFSDGSIPFKRWFNADKVFTQGNANLFACPAS
jgi:hypothetical protein